MAVAPCLQGRELSVEDGVLSKLPSRADCSAAQSSKGELSMIQSLWLFELGVGFMLA